MKSLTLYGYDNNVVIETDFESSNIYSYRALPGVYLGDLTKAQSPMAEICFHMNGSVEVYSEYVLFFSTGDVFSIKIIPIENGVEVRDYYNKDNWNEYYKIEHIKKSKLDCQHVKTMAEVSEAFFSDILEINSPDEISWVTLSQSVIIKEIL